MSRIEVWAVDESRVEVMSEHPRRWSVLLALGIGWVLFAVLVLTYHVETLTTLAVFTGATFIAGGISVAVSAWTLERGRRWPMVLMGVAGVGLGIVPLVWPQPSIYFLASLIGWFLVVSGLAHFVRSLFHTAERYWWTGSLLGIAEFVIGAWAAAYPGRSLAVFATLLGIYALVRGTLEIFAAFALRGLDRDLRVAPTLTHEPR